MTDLNVRATEEARGYLEEIAREMVLLFPITLDEALGRINREFADRRFLTEVEVNVLLHEEQDTWAKHVYYGRESCWWLGEEGLCPQPYP
jgi:hypothetical protein